MIHVAKLKGPKQTLKCQQSKQPVMDELVLSARHTKETKRPQLHLSPLKEPQRKALRERKREREGGGERGRGREREREGERGREGECKRERKRW